MTFQSAAAWPAFVTARSSGGWLRAAHGEQVQEFVYDLVVNLTSACVTGALLVTVKRVLTVWRSRRHPDAGQHEEDTNS